MKTKIGADFTLNQLAIIILVIILIVISIIALRRVESIQQGLLGIL